MKATGKPVCPFCPEQELDSFHFLGCPFFGEDQFGESVALARKGKNRELFRLIFGRFVIFRRTDELAPYTAGEREIALELQVPIG